MKKTQYRDEQIVRILRETNKNTAIEVAKRHGVSAATINIWRKQYGQYRDRQDQAPEGDRDRKGISSQKQPSFPYFSCQFKITSNIRSAKYPFQKMESDLNFHLFYIH
ncbi:hypothetical protein CBF45_07770 [Bordetella sp. J329]|nr:hypothetical protein CBF45_07770 [Bordetella sp. J329]